MEKILAVAIFVVMFALIIWDRFPRQWVTLGSGALVLVLVFKPAGLLGKRVREKV